MFPKVGFLNLSCWLWVDNFQAKIKGGGTNFCDTVPLTSPLSADSVLGAHVVVLAPVEVDLLQLVLTLTWIRCIEEG